MVSCIFNTLFFNNFSSHPLWTVAFKLEQPQHASRTRKKRKKNRPRGKSHQEQQQQQRLPSCQLPGRRQVPSLSLPLPLPRLVSSALPMPCRAKRCRETRTRFKGCQLPIEAVKYAKQFDSQRDCVGVSVSMCVCVYVRVCVQQCDIYCCFCQIVKRRLSAVGGSQAFSPPSRSHLYALPRPCLASCISSACHKSPGVIWILGITALGPTNGKQQREAKATDWKLFYAPYKMSGEIRWSEE